MVQLIGAAPIYEGRRRSIERMWLGAGSVALRAGVKMAGGGGWRGECRFCRGLLLI